MENIKYTTNSTGIKTIKVWSILVLIFGVIGGLITLIIGIENISYSFSEVEGFIKIRIGVLTVVGSFIFYAIGTSLSSINNNLQILRSIEEHKLAEKGILLEISNEKINYEVIAVQSDSNKNNK